MPITSVLAPLSGHAVALAQVPDPVFAQGMVGYGAAVEPPDRLVDVVAPVSGRLLKLLPHAFVVLTADNVGVLVHLGLDTVALAGEGFTARLGQSAEVAAGQTVISYDVPLVRAKGLNPIVPVVVMDEREASHIAVCRAVTAGMDIAAGAELFVANNRDGRVAEC